MKKLILLLTSMCISNLSAMSKPDNNRQYAEKAEKTSKKARKEQKRLSPQEEKRMEEERQRRRELWDGLSGIR